MKRLFSALIILTLVLPLKAAEPIDLLQDDWDAALSEAGESGKCLYVAFLGDGWSVSSNRFQERILESEAFKELTEARLIYCPVRARRTPKLDKEETARLQALVIHLDIKSYPTVVLIAPDGSEILRHGYREDSAEDYLALISAVIPGGTD